jgi:hypothetical protein
MTGAAGDGPAGYVASLSAIRGARAGVAPDPAARFHIVSYADFVPRVSGHVGRAGRPDRRRRDLPALWILDRD